MRSFCYFLMLISAVVCSSCNRESRSEKRKRKWKNAVTAKLFTRDLKGFLERQMKWKDSLNIRMLTVDSAIHGLRETKIYDTNGNRITKQEANILLLTGKYNLKVVGIVDVKFFKKTKEQLDIDKFQTPKKCSQFPVHSLFLDFQATDITGLKLSNKTFKGKILVVNFWFLACGPCRAEMNDLNSIVEENAGKPVNFISFTPDKKEQIKKSFTQLNFKYKIIPDQQLLITELGIDGFPTHVIVDQMGRVIFSCTDSGPHVIYWLKKTIDSCLTVSK